MIKEGRCFKSILYDNVDLKKEDQTTITKDGQEKSLSCQGYIRIMIKAVKQYATKRFNALCRDGHYYSLISEFALVYCQYKDEIKPDEFVLLVRLGWKYFNRMYKQEIDYKGKVDVVPEQVWETWQDTTDMDTLQNDRALIRNHIAIIYKKVMAASQEGEIKDIRISYQNKDIRINTAQFLDAFQQFNS